MNASFKEQAACLSSASPVPTNVISRYLSEKPLRTALALLQEDIAGASVLFVCSGRGDEAVMLQAYGCQVTATDISSEACQLIQKRDPRIVTRMADAEHLPFADASIDYVMVKHGLHHLPRPPVGLYEMLRVARKGIVVMEAHDSWMMRVLLAVRLVAPIEESGNYVYRFSRREMRKIFNTLFIRDVRIHTEWYQYIPFLERSVFPKLNHPLFLRVFKTILFVFNAVCGRWGNNFIMVVKK